MHMNTFEIGNLWRFADHIGFENQAVVLDPNPDAVLLNASRRARTKPARIALQRTNAAFLESHRSINRENFFQIVQSCRPQIINAVRRVSRRPLLVQKLTTNQARFLSDTGVVFPESVD